MLSKALEGKGSTRVQKSKEWRDGRCPVLVLGCDLAWASLDGVWTRRNQGHLASEPGDKRMTVPSHSVGKGGGKTKAGLIRWDGVETLVRMSGTQDWAFLAAFSTWRLSQCVGLKGEGGRLCWTMWGKGTSWRL